MNLQRLKQLAGTSSLYESVQAIPGLGEALAPAQIDSAQNDIDLDQGSQFEEDVESPAQVVSCNQDNPAPGREACAMEEGLGDTDRNFLIPSIEQCSMYARNMEELIQLVAKETGYDPTPEFADMVTQEYNKYMGVESEGEPEPDYTDQSMRAGEMGMEEAYDMNNGYHDVETANGQDYFPSGATSSVTSKVGPSGARQGDNPEQKKMEVAETHKELVYNYRSFLKEVKLNELSKDTLKSYANKRGAEVRADKRDADRSREQGKYAAGVGDPKSAAGWNDDAEQLDKRAEKGAGNVAKAVIKVAKKK